MRRRITLAVTAVVWFSGAWPQTAAAQSRVAPEAAKPAMPDPLKRNTPQSAVLNFLRIARHVHDRRAAPYLQLTRKTRGKGPNLAAQLAEILNRNLSGDLMQLSALPEGDPEDPLYPARQSIGVLPISSGDFTSP